LKLVGGWYLWHIRYEIAEYAGAWMGTVVQTRVVFVKMPSTRHILSIPAPAHAFRYSWHCRGGYLISWILLVRAGFYWFLLDYSGLYLEN